MVEVQSSPPPPRLAQDEAASASPAHSKKSAAGGSTPPATSKNSVASCWAASPPIAAVTVATATSSGSIASGTTTSATARLETAPAVSTSTTTDVSSSSSSVPAGEATHPLQLRAAATVTGATASAASSSTSSSSSQELQLRHGGTTAGQPTNANANVGSSGERETGSPISAPEENGGERPPTPPSNRNSEPDFEMQVEEQGPVCPSSSAGAPAAHGLNLKLIPPIAGLNLEAVVTGGATTGGAEGSSSGGAGPHQMPMPMSPKFVCSPRPSGADFRKGSFTCPSRREEERSTIARLQKTHEPGPEDAPLHLVHGKYYYLVAKKWWLEWQQWVGHESVGSPKQSPVLPQSPRVWTKDRPGPIANAELLDFEPPKRDREGVDEKHIYVSAEFIGYVGDYMVRMYPDEQVGGASSSTSSAGAGVDPDVVQLAEKSSAPATATAAAHLTMSPASDIEMGGESMTPPHHCSHSPPPPPAEVIEQVRHDISTIELQSQTGANSTVSAVSLSDEQPVVGGSAAAATATAAPTAVTGTVTGSATNAAAAAGVPGTSSTSSSSSSSSATPKHAEHMDETARSNLNLATVPLRKGAQRPDFVVVHEAVWKQLVEYYGYDYAIRRRALDERAAPPVVGRALPPADSDEVRGRQQAARPAGPSASSSLRRPGILEAGDLAYYAPMAMEETDAHLETSQRSPSPPAMEIDELDELFGVGPAAACDEVGAHVRPAAPAGGPTSTSNNNIDGTRGGAPGAPADAAGDEAGGGGVAVSSLLSSAASGAVIALPPPPPATSAAVPSSAASEGEGAGAPTTTVIQHAHVKLELEFDDAKAALRLPVHHSTFSKEKKQSGDNFQPKGVPSLLLLESRACTLENLRLKLADYFGIEICEGEIGKLPAMEAGALNGNKAAAAPAGAGAGTAAVSSSAASSSSSAGPGATATTGETAASTSPSAAAGASSSSSVPAPDAAPAAAPPVTAAVIGPQLPVPAPGVMGDSVTDLRIPSPMTGPQQPGSQQLPPEGEVAVAVGAGTTVEVGGSVLEADKNTNSANNSPSNEPSAAVSSCPAEASAVTAASSAGLGEEQQAASSSSATAGPERQHPEQPTTTPPKRRRRVVLYDYFGTKVGAGSSGLRGSAKICEGPHRITENNALLLHESDDWGNVMQLPKQPATSSFGTGSFTLGGMGNAFRSPEDSATSGQKPEVQPRGAVGLQNLGNTCYMNSSLQCLAAVPALRNFFTGEDMLFQQHLNPKAFKSEGKLAEAFAGLLKLMDAAENVKVAPRGFKQKMGEVAEMFQGFMQHDGMEYIEFLVDGLKEDTNLIRGPKPYVQFPDDDVRCEEDILRATLDIAKRRSNSYLDELLFGLERSRLKCPKEGCGKVSVTFSHVLATSLHMVRDQKCVSLTVNVVKQGVPFCEIIEPLSNSNPSKAEDARGSAGPALVAGGGSRGSCAASGASSSTSAVAFPNAFPDPFPNAFATPPAVAEDIQLEPPSQQETTPTSGLNRTGTNNSTTAARFRSQLSVDMPKQANCADLVAKLAQTYPDVCGHWDLNKNVLLVAIVADQQHRSSSSGAMAKPKQYYEPRDCLDTIPTDDVLYVYEVEDRAHFSEDMVAPAAGPVAATMSPEKQECQGQQEADSKRESQNGNYLPDAAAQEQDQLEEREDEVEKRGGVEGAPASVPKNGIVMMMEDARIPPLVFSAPSDIKVFDFYELVWQKAKEHLPQCLQPVVRDPQQKAPDRECRVLISRTYKGHTWGNYVTFDGDTLLRRTVELPVENVDMVGGEDSDAETVEVPNFDEEVFGNDQNPGKKYFRLEVKFPEDLSEADSQAVLKNLHKIPPPRQIGSDKKRRIEEEVHLRQLLEMYGEEEQLGEDELWRCPRCDERVPGFKKLDFYRLPPVFLIHLKRFQFTRWSRERIDTPVNFPARMDLNSLVIDRAPQVSAINYEYELTAIVKHMGIPDGGHYVAFAKYGSVWFEFNDGIVTPQTEAEVLQEMKGAYVLFYTRTDFVVGSSSERPAATSEDTALTSVREMMQNLIAVVHKTAEAQAIEPTTTSASDGEAASTTASAASSCATMA